MTSLDEWSLVKKKITTCERRLPYFKEGEVWWCMLGENVGVEVNGKGSRYTRPVIIMRKFSQHSFFALPLTTKRRFGSWYVSFRYREILQTAMLSQSQTVSAIRLDRRIGMLAKRDLKKVQEALLRLLSS